MLAKSRLLSLTAISLFLALTLTSCFSSKHVITVKTETTAEQVWTYSLSHPDGFTIDIRTMTEPTEGISVAYAATQGCHTREALDSVVSHAIKHNGFVGGWLDTTDSLYYFDSTRIFPEDSLEAAKKFGIENGQIAIFVISEGREIRLDIDRIQQRGVLLAGTTGDYRPLSFVENDSVYWGFEIDMAAEIARNLGVDLQFVLTSWPTLTNDVLAEPQTFDFAISGITITDERLQIMVMSDGYLANGKTILCRVEDTTAFHSLSDIDKAEVRVMVNPGGMNEKFAKENLTNSTIIVYPVNEEIPSLVAQGDADVMITEITEAPWYVQNDPRLAAPLLNKPFTHGEIGILMRKGQKDLLQYVNNLIHKMKEDGSLQKLKEKYGLK